MAVDALLLGVGLGLLLAGGDLLVRGASGLARAFGVSPLVVGLTVVAFGTSAPELAVTLTAALQDRGALAFGNVVGSNLANIGLVVAASALLRPLPIETAIVTREIPMMLLATVAALVMGLDQLMGREAVFDLGDGLLLLLIFTVFLYYTTQEVRRQRLAGPLVDETRALPRGVTKAPLGRQLVFVTAGALGLFLGSQWTVAGGIGLARALGVSEAVIGLSVVAVGTSLPELAAALVATAKGHADLAIGNVVGSNIFNLLFVLAVCALVRPVPVPARGVGDLVVATGLAAALLLVAASHSRRIIRAEGAGLLLVYLAHLTGRVLLG